MKFRRKWTGIIISLFNKLCIKSSRSNNSKFMHCMEMLFYIYMPFFCFVLFCFHWAYSCKINILFQCGTLMLFQMKNPKPWYVRYLICTYPVNIAKTKLELKFLSFNNLFHLLLFNMLSSEIRSAVPFKFNLDLWKIIVLWYTSVSFSSIKVFILKHLKYYQKYEWNEC